MIDHGRVRRIPTVRGGEEIDVFDWVRLNWQSRLTNVLVVPEFPARRYQTGLARLTLEC